MRVGELCVRDTVIVKKDESVGEAAKLMQRHHVGTLVVVDELREKNIPSGIITDRDIALNVVAGDRSHDTPVGDIISKEFHSVNENASLYDTLGVMKDKGIRRVPVVDEAGYLVGILSVDDIYEFLTEEMEAIEALFARENLKEHQKR